MANRIVDLIKSDTYTVAEICRIVKISKTTFYKWQDEHPEFRESVQAAREKLKEFVTLQARKSLLKKIQGFYLTETKIISIPGGKGDDGQGKPQIKEFITTRKYIPADINAIIFVLTNCEPEIWKRQRKIEIARNDKENRFAKMSDEDIEKIIDDFLKKK